MLGDELALLRSQVIQRGYMVAEEADVLSKIWEIDPVSVRGFLHELPTSLQIDGGMFKGIILQRSTDVQTLLEHHGIRS